MVVDSFRFVSALVEPIFILTTPAGRALSNKLDQSRDAFFNPKEVLLEKTRAERKRTGFTSRCHCGHRDFGHHYGDDGRLFKICVEGTTDGSQP